MTRPDLTERLLLLGEGERGLLQDLYQARFATPTVAEALAALSGGSLGALEDGGFLKAVETAQGPVLYLSQTGVRAALALLGPAQQSASRAYAALRLRHELRRAELYVALRGRGMRAASYRAEPRLAYRSAAGLGPRTLVPDAQVAAPEGDALIEVDLGTEGAAQLRHKWLRYREWQEDAPRRALYVLAATPETVRDTLASAGLVAHVAADPRDLARAVWP